jgi:LmbE family N-acetylglucosaminyl deacetylase
MPVLPVRGGRKIAIILALMASDLQLGSPAERIVVISPHSDDGVISLGASMSFWARAGSRVELLTVLALDPNSNAEARGWDRRAGFRTEGDAGRARRDEDRQACDVLGAVPSWLPFGSVDFERHGEERDIWNGVASFVDAADLVLIPGSPLTHPDHAWLTRTLLERPLPCRQLGLYQEQPYAFKEQLATKETRMPDWLGKALGSSLTFERIATARRDRLAKLRAIRRYPS